ncbi:T9SS type A sorting domain-containing protein [Psychroflexus planctonicus]|uniref:Secretion system C-terminal sorting domain-containing protein n=1 Tax=Psychroflexus planctonicus TaxID=1526575 RepID=A0ABQ1SK40_9FLAO|nr:Omp28-related outer membrane protein [Psychroflexus planctonicus]GGE39196.1 hypothetical protein GCM10010832_19330 [Psychroflexus planctonicus]
MLKKLLTSCAVFAFAFSAFSQTMVSTTPENKNVILEEFTGINCQFCPQGHAIAQGIQENNPGDVFLINIHVGGFATPGPSQPDFRTPFGTAIDSQADVSGYPAGTINRALFPSFSQNPGGTSMGRQHWVNASNQVLGQSSYVNVATEAEIDINTNQITVHVEAYYTGNSPEDSNKLNVALLQNNTLGPQSGGGMGDNYVHMHRLVHMLTGQWGVDINTTTQGSFIDQTFTYTIPENYNGISADVFEGEFEVVAFITETQENIISGSGASASLTGFANSNDAVIKSVDEFDNLCVDSVAPSFEILNFGSNPLTSVDVEYDINGGTTEVYTWTGNLAPGEFEKIDLPEMEFTLLETNEFNINLSDDDDNSNNSYSFNFDASEIFETNTVELNIQLDQYPEETTWNITNSAGGVVHSGGPYNGQQNQSVQQTLNLTENDCYTFTIMDAYGDGICCDWGDGSYSLETSDGTVIIQGGSFGSQESKTYSNYNSLSVPNFDVYNFSMYPNPTSGKINLSANENFGYEVFTLQGKKILTGESKNMLSNQLDLSNFTSGVYLIKVNINGASRTQKIILK